MTPQEAIRDGLLHIRTNGPNTLYCGICANLDWQLDKNEEFEWGSSITTDNLLRQGFKAWPRFSGDVQAPVPAPEDALPSERDPYTYYINLPHIGEVYWDRETPYGQARWELLDFLIEYFEHLTEAEHGNAT